MASRCGSCTMCCRLTEVPELDKPPGDWCKFCDIGKGCKVYDVRPASCRKFECLWYADETLPLSLRPDNCKVVFERLGELNICLAMVSPHYHSSLRKPEVRDFINKLLKSGYSVAVNIYGTSKRYLILAEGHKRDEILDQINQYAIQTGVLRKDHGSAIIRI